MGFILREKLLMSTQAIKYSCIDIKMLDRLVKDLKPNHLNLKSDVDDTLTSFLLDLVLLAFRLLLLTPVLATFPFVPPADLLTFLRFPVQSEELSVIKIWPIFFIAVLCFSFSYIISCVLVIMLTPS